MLKDGCKVTVHFVNHWNSEAPAEFRTGITGKVFEVKTVNGKAGFDGNINRCPYTSRGELFTPFSSYSWSVLFRDEKTGRFYRYSNIKGGLEDVTGKAANIKFVA